MSKTLPNQLLSRGDSTTRIINQQEYIENEMRLSERHFNEQNLFDEKITNNMLKISLALSTITIIINILRVLSYECMIYVLSLSPNKDYHNNLQLDEIKFSVFRFEVLMVHKRTHQINSYGCLKNTAYCTNNCVGIDLLKDLNDDYNLPCSFIRQVETANIIVIFNNYLSFSLQ